jgi:peroxiredoxin
MTARLMPRQAVPALEVELVGGGRWSLAAQQPQHFTMLVFYRGLHCPVCRKYLGELNGLVERFAVRGVNVLALSSDARERAEETKARWGLERLDVGYGLSIDAARQWGLYVSTHRGKTSIGIEEPALFSEPGVFLVRPDHTLYWLAIQTMPFARPHFDEILAAMDFAIDKGYPARGEA